ncbi:MAG TPA: hypothetical protein VF126_17095 [Acidobacteriaceae bacterium]
MHPLSVQELLSVWERGLDARPYERALLLLAAAEADSTKEQLAAWSLGHRDDSLLALRECAFGSELNVVAVCPRCTQELEMLLSVPALRASAASAAGNSEGEVSLGQYQVRCRPANSGDLMKCRGTDLETIRAELLARCVLEARWNDEPVEASALPQEVAEAATQQMAASDPQADIRIALDCSACRHHWEEVFDIVSFFWTEIDAWSRRLLREVHVLATAYGWRESDVLTLSPARRQIYLAMAQA